MKVLGFIIARMGSKRVPLKNLRILNGKPMMQYAVEAARDAKCYDNVYLNTESEKLGQFGIDHGIQFHHRDPAYSEDHVILDDITTEFLQHHECDVVSMINTVCPLTTSEDIDKGFDYFIKNDLDTLLTIREEHLHSFLDGNGVNIDPSKKIPMTQDLKPVQIVTWNYTFWKTESFLKSMKENQFGVFSGKLGLYPIGKEKAVKVSEESDFKITEALLEAQEREHKVEYFEL